jgi:hypothetical protein
MVVFPAEFVRPVPWHLAGGGGGWGFLIVAAVIVVVAGGLLIGHIVHRSVKRNRTMKALMADLYQEASRALRNPVLVHQARRRILQTRDRDSG